MSSEQPICNFNKKGLFGILTQSGKKSLFASFKNSTKITLISRVYESMLKWANYNPICTEKFCRIFIQSFHDF